MSDLIIIGGPNGAGKTTAAPAILGPELGIREFVNADEIARGLSPMNPENAAMAAGRLLLNRIHDLAQKGESFAFETTCAGRTHAQLLRRCKAMGYRITLFYLWLPSPQDALDRVAKRVSAGGHDIPRDVVIRRHAVGLRNLGALYMPLVDSALIYDNASDERILIAEKTPDAMLIHDPVRWRMIEKAMS